MLIASEVFEAFGSYRKRENLHIPEEFADVVIRIMDLFEFEGWDLEYEIRQKHEFNKGRPYRHGGKVC